MYIYIYMHKCIHTWGSMQRSLSRVMIARTVHIMSSSPRDSFFRVCENNMLFRASDFDPAKGRHDARERFAKAHFFS